MIMTRSTLFTASQPSQLLSPYTPRPPPSPPMSLLESLSVGRSSSLRSGKDSPPASRDYPFSLPASPISDSQSDEETSEVTTKQSAILSPTGYSSRQSSLKPKLLPLPIHPRRRSWFREDNPSAFLPPSPDPSALSPMATFHSSMSEDEQRDELWSNASSQTPASLYSLSPSLPTHPYTHKQDSDERKERMDAAFRPFSIVNEGEFLAIPARTRSDSAPRRSNPALLVNGTEHDFQTEMIPRRASEGGTVSTSLSPSSAALSHRGSSQSCAAAFASTFQPRILHSDRVYERSGSPALSSGMGTKPKAVLRNTYHPSYNYTAPSQPQCSQPRSQLLRHSHPEPRAQNNDQQNNQPDVQVHNKKSSWERSPFQRSSGSLVESN